MRKIFIPVFIFITSALMAQEGWMATYLTAFVANLHGQPLQYGFVASNGDWQPNRKSEKFQFDPNMTNGIQIQTVAGVTMLWAVESHDICKAKCSYLGTFSSPPEQEIVTWLDGSTSLRISGNLTGQFVGPKGMKLVSARFYVETYSALDGIIYPGPGGLIVELQPN